MPQQPVLSVENNFTKGLITEATGLNFPENACTETSNCIFTLIGDVTRREGINEELNGTTHSVITAGLAFSSYTWNNPGGDGNSKLLVKQIGGTLYFYNIASATVADPLSTQILTGTVSLAASLGNTLDTTKECSYADGNGYLFVYHASCEPSYVTYNPSLQTVALSAIQVQVRDFYGLNDGLQVTTRPTTLSTEHNYNIANQGWTSGNTFNQSSQTNVFSQLGPASFTVSSGLSVSNGTLLQLYATLGLYIQARGVFILQTTLTALMSASVTSYSGTTLSVNVYNVQLFGTSPVTPTANFYGGDGVTYHFLNGNNYSLLSPWSITSINSSTTTTWFADEGNYPSNADVWWYFKDDTGTFNPTTTQPSVTLATGNAPQGHFILSAFNLDRTAASGIAGITPVTTTARPTTGCWFQGRVWYAGASSSFAATGDASFYTWTENIYFSQIVMTPTDFGSCYQTNDPTSENLNSLLPTDGGVITLVGCGTIHKLFPITNGLLVFANNGIWFITGSQGIGFAADDYTITKISAIKVLSHNSFVDVLGLPMFWNEEDIYVVAQGQNGGLTVSPLAVGTILTYYNNIPLSSKKYARGAYDPINYIIQWCYLSTPETGITNRYQFDTVLTFNTYNKAWYPYNISNTGPAINGIDYISYPFITNQTPDPILKYSFTNSTGTGVSFAEEYDTNYVDWGSVNYTSDFTTGYRVHGQGMRDVNIPYLHVYSRLGQAVAYYIQSIWNYANTGNSGKWSVKQLVNIFNPNYDMMMRRHRLRGRGKVLQFKISSVDGMPFDIMGWAAYEMQNTGV